VNLLADEGVDAPIVARLRGDGHDVVYVAELAPGIGDEAVLELAREEGRVLVTTDKDFGELVFRQRRVPGGVVLLRLAELPPARRAEVVSAALAEHEAEMGEAFSVVSPGQIRIRTMG